MGESTFSILGAGGMAGIFSWIFTYPQDVIKSRLQADGWGQAQEYRGASHCLHTSVANEGLSCLVRGIGSTVIRAFPMNAVTFGVYSYIMKTYGDEEEDSYDTMKKVNDQWDDTLQSQKVSTLATDGPNIVFVQEPMISPISQARLYPEQMLWACPGATSDDDKWQTMEKMIHDGSFSNYCNFNLFTQRSPLDDLYNEPEVLPSNNTANNFHAMTHECHDEHHLSCPSLLCSSHQMQNRRHITTKDFLLPTNLLSTMKTKDRIYGFYYIVA